MTATEVHRGLQRGQALGGDDVTTPSARTPDQTQIALFWVESSPLQWNRIARSVAASTGLDRGRARLFGLLNMALADGYIGTFETKYHYRYWRPVTAIRGRHGRQPRTPRGPDLDAAAADSPIPDYDSAHAVEGGAAAAGAPAVLRDRRSVRRLQPIAARRQPVRRCGPVLRSYSSFSQAAAENAMSRILVGYHFRKGVEEGIEHGRKVGNRAVDRFMRPTNR